ncbi:MAG: TIGR00366 family protein [Treponema sp.]|nr:TIGR00366 family protein [Treponema sp.]
MSSNTLEKRSWMDGFIRFFNRWMPNSMVIAYVLTAVVVVLALVFTSTPFVNFKPNIPLAQLNAGVTANSVIEAWGAGFWSLLELAMQMSLILITGSVIAASPFVRMGLKKLASKPNNMGQAILLVMLTIPLFNWFHFGLGIMLGIHLGRHIIMAAREKGYKIHNPLFVAILYGCGITGIGISQIAPVFGNSTGLIKRVIFAAKPAEFLANVPDRVPYAETVFSLQNVILCIVALIVCFGAIYLIRPKKEENYVAPSNDLYEEIETQQKLYTQVRPKPTSVAEALDNSPIVNFIIGAFGIVWVVRFFAVDGQLNFNNFNMLMLVIALLLSGTPNAFIRMVQMSLGQTWGVIIQFPFYAGIFGIITYTGLNRVFVEFFMSFATQGNWPLLTYIYTSIVNIAVPNGAAKFMVVAPYAFEVAVENNVPLSKMILAYTAGDFSTNGFLPFWALPYLAMFKLDFKHILPYTAIGGSAVYIIFMLFFIFIV